MTYSDTPEIIGSKLLAKAIVERDGKFEIVGIFERSHQYKFALVFSARSKRSPRKSWKWTGRYHILQDARRRNYRDPSNQPCSLEILLENCYGSHVKTVRYAQKKRYVQTFIQRIANPFAEGFQRIPPPPGATFERANRITSGKRRGQV